MPQCEHHDDYIKLHDGLKEHIGMVERNLDEKIKGTDKKLDTAFVKIDSIREELDEQGKDHRETATYVKQLYRRFDELAVQMQNIVTKLDTYITTMAAISQKTNSNSEFTKSGKQLVFEIIKWIALLVVGAALSQAGK